MDNRKIGKFKDMFYLIDEKIRKNVFKLNQAGFVTFTSSQGNNIELPKIGIVCKSLYEANEIIKLIDTNKTNIWYELSNRWYKENPMCCNEINYDNQTNCDNICKPFDLDWDRCYFLLFKAKTLKELDDLTDFLIKKE